MRPMQMRARVWKRLWNPGMDSEEWFRQAGNRFLGPLKGLQIRALNWPIGIGSRDMSANAQPIFFTNVVSGSLKILTFKTLIQYAFNIVLFLLFNIMTLSEKDIFSKKASSITPFSPITINCIGLRLWVCI